MKKQKRGGCKLFQSLARAFSRKKKLNVSDADGIPVEPFSSDHDVSEAKQAAVEKDPTGQGTPQDKVHAKAHSKPQVPVKAAKATSIDLDKVQREAGLINSEIAKDRLKIRPSKRAPRKYAERLEQRSDSVDRIPEVPVTVKSESSKATENLLLASNQKGKGSVTPEGNARATEGNTNNEKSNKAPAVAQKQRDDATEGNGGSGFRRLPSEKKLAKRLPRADLMEQASAHGTESDAKTAGTANQLGSDDSLAGKGSTKAVGNVHLEAEIASSSFRGSGKKSGTAEGLSQSTTGGRKLPRTLLSAGENESGTLPAEPLTNEGDSKLASTAKLHASGSSLNTSEPGLRESHRRSSKAIKSESAAKYLGVGEEDAKLNNNRLRSSGRGSTKTKVNPKETNVESEAKASKIRDSTKKKKDGKKERNSVVDITDDTSAENGIPKGEGKPVEHAGENSWTDINQNENLSSSLKNRLPDTTGVCHIESSEENATKASRQLKEAKTGIQRAPSAVKENGLKETSVGEVTGDGSLTSRGGVKPAKDRGIPEIAIHGDAPVAKTTENRKSWRIEPHGAKALAATRHSRDASIDSTGNSTLESSEGEKMGEGTKTAPLLLSSSESISAAGETGGSSFKASGEADENEFSKAFKKIKKTKQTTSEVLSRNSFRLHPDQPKDGDGVAVTSSSENGIPMSGSLKVNENLSENRLGASVKSLRGSGRKAGGDPKPAENHSTVGEEDRKPGSVTTDADDGGEGESSLNKRKLPPAPPANKRSVKVQPKPAENGKEVAWASMARRMSREFSDKKLQNFEAKSDEQNPDHDVEGEGNFERGGNQASVKQLVKKLQQK